MNDGDDSQQPQPFVVRDCALVVLAAGISAQNLRELRDGLRRADPDSIYHHFWGRLLQPLFDEPEYNNDFASWAYRALNDKAVAERLSVIDPTDYEDIEALRDELVEIVEMRLDESEFPSWAQADQQFHFLRSQIVVFDTGVRVDEPHQLATVVPAIGEGSVFYHFIDARRRTEDRTDDLCGWLAGYGKEYDPLIEQLSEIDPYFSSLHYIRKMLTRVLESYFPEVAA